MSEWLHGALLLAGPKPQHPLMQHPKESKGHGIPSSGRLLSLGDGAWTSHTRRILIFVYFPTKLKHALLIPVEEEQFVSLSAI